MMQAVAVCAEPNVLRGLVQSKPPNQPSLSVEMGIAVTHPRCPGHHSAQKRPSATKTN
jgi:hypothetical protein